MRFAIIIVAGASLLIAGAAHAEDKRDCRYLVHDKDLGNIALGTIIGGKVRFVANQSDKAECPSAAKSCALPAFLRKKDQVVFIPSPAGDYLCAAYVDARGEETTGWLPAASVKVATPKPTWTGRWKQYEFAEIEIRRKPGGKADVTGSAVHGEGGAQMEGGIEGVIDTTKTVQSFATSGIDPISYEQAGQYDCAVIMKQLGPYLFVADNRSCGGANISFTGVYRKR